MAGDSISQGEQREHVYRANRPGRMERDAFLSVFGAVYEHSPWICEQAWERGTNGAATAEALHAKLVAVVEEASRQAQLDLLNAHPDLAGKLAKAGKLTDISASEQAAAGLDQCSPEEFDAFLHYNARYRERFGFPFILAVRGRTREDILRNLEARLDNSPEAEFAEALAQVHRIALIRLRQIP